MRLSTVSLRRNRMIESLAAETGKNASTTFRLPLSVPVIERELTRRSQLLMCLDNPRSHPDVPCNL